MKSLSKEIPGQPNFISPDLIDQLNPKHRLVILANKISWQELEESLSVYYAANYGRPAKPIRLMIGLLVLERDKKFRFLYPLLHTLPNKSNASVEMIFTG